VRLRRRRQGLSGQVPRVRFGLAAPTSRANRLLAFETGNLLKYLAIVAMRDRNRHAAVWLKLEVCRNRY
jgi:hypothetical protein